MRRRLLATLLHFSTSLSILYLLSSHLHYSRQSQSSQLLSVIEAVVVIVSAGVALAFPADKWLYSLAMCAINSGWPYLPTLTKHGWAKSYFFAWIPNKAI